ncbi:major capsid protein [Salinarimonas sp.]|uniref:major capsid protein n=1 Tax=Salinarimonas sp. TaxID=2766526 RepID=UPI00391BC7AA
MPMGLDIWSGDAFTLQTLTAAVNKQPYRPGQISARGIFEEDGVSTTTVSIEMRDGKLGLVEPSQRGGPGETIDDDTRSLVPVTIPHYQRDDSVLADEVQNVREFGSMSALEQIQDRVNRKAARHAQDLTMTLEHQRIGAIKGIVMSKSGGTLLNLYQRFSVPVPNAVSLDVANADADVIGILQGVQYSIEDAFDEDATYTGLHVFSGRDLHTQLWRHPQVQKTFLYHAGAEILREDVPEVYKLGAFTFERYRTGVKATADAGAAYIAPNEARVVPLGVPDLFQTRFAPADYEETVNTIGVPFYVKQWARPDDKGRHLQVQMNAMSWCTRPQVLRRLTIGA